MTPSSNRSTFDVTYLGALTDKWLGWAPLRNEQSVCNKRSKLPPLPLLPPLILMVQFVVLLLLLLFAGDVANPGLGKCNINVYYCTSESGIWLDVTQVARADIVS